MWNDFEMAGWKFIQEVLWFTLYFSKNGWSGRKKKRSRHKPQIQPHSPKLKAIQNGVQSKQGEKLNTRNVKSWPYWSHWALCCWLQGCQDSVQRIRIVVIYKKAGRSRGEYLKTLILASCLSDVGCLLVNNLVWEGERAVFLLSMCNTSFFSKKRKHVCIFLMSLK